MRIIGGEKRGTKLLSPNTDAIRPTEDRIKENMFNLLGHIQGSLVLDAFAGSGALGLEALSRGAEKVYFCEKNKESYQCLKANIEKISLKGYTMYYGDVYDAIKGYKEAFDLVFFDPPYKEMTAYWNLARKLREENLLKDGARLVFERNQDLEACEDFQLLKSKRYGKKWIDIYQWSRK